MNYRIKYLKVKIKSLAAEQVIIRQERHRARRAHAGSQQPAEAAQWVQLMDGLQAHRLQAVRPEIRAALMAYGLLRGKRPEQIEPRAKTPVNEKRVQELMRKYGPPGGQALKAA